MRCAQLAGFHPACHTAELSMFSKTPEMLTFIKDSKLSLNAVVCQGFGGR